MYNYTFQKRLINKHQFKNKMKKITAIIVLTAGLMVNTAQAQNKMGYISIENMLLLMPETSKIDSLLERYQQDSINAEFAQVFRMYTFKDSLLNKTDTAKMPLSYKNELKKDLANYAYQINNWQSISQQAVQAKQNALLDPIYKKIYEAINTVAKEKGYAYVYTQEALLVAPPADNLLPLVAEKLKVKLPPAAAGTGANAQQQAVKPTIQTKPKQ